MRRLTRGFTLIEMLVVIAITAALVSMLLPLLGRARDSARAVKDATNQRSIVQALTVWSMSDKERFPLPSRLDADNTTLPLLTNHSAREKDNTGNIFSILVFNGHLTPKVLVSPAENNAAIASDDGYEYTSPSYAEGGGERALWDPGFAGMPGENNLSGVINGIPRRGQRREGTGNISYAHMPPFGDRLLKKWRVTGAGNEPVLGTRGPLYEGLTGNWTLVPNTSGEQSNRMKFFGSRDKWSGNVAYNDTHVKFETRPDPTSVPIILGQTVVRLPAYYDNIFVNEDESNGTLGMNMIPSTGSNALLQIYGNVFATSLLDDYAVMNFED